MIDLAPTAQDQLVARALAIGRRTALGVLGDREAAADVAQDVALAALQTKLRDPARSMPGCTASPSGAR